MVLHAFQLTFSNTFKRTEKSGAVDFSSGSCSDDSRQFRSVYSTRSSVGAWLLLVFPRWSGVLMIKQHIAEGGVHFSRLVDRYVLNQTEA